MFDAAQRGGGDGRSARVFPPRRTILQRVALGCALLLGMACWSGARAGALYHCTGSRGETVFSNRTAGYHACRKIRSYGEVRRHVRPRHPAAKVSLARVAGEVETTARSLAADGGRPTSLARVEGSAFVATAAGAGAARLADVAPRPSLLRVIGSVTSTARAPAWLLPEGATPGHWGYRETADATSATVAPAAKHPSGPRVLRGSVYRVVRRDGSVEYTNLRPAGKSDRAVTMLFSYIATCAACNLHSTIHWGSVPLQLTAYAGAIHAASREYGVDEAFLRAIIHAESAFNPRALSSKGAQGLMQLMPGTASDMGVQDAFDAAENIRGGARYLSLLLRNFHGDERLAAAAYNAGPGAVQRYDGVPPYSETQVYVRRVGTLRKRYGAAIHTPLVAGRAASAEVGNRL